MRFDHWAISRVAKKYNKSPAQVLLRYSVQKVRGLISSRIHAQGTYKGYIPLPKTVSKERMVSNADIFDFELSEIEMADFDGLDEGEE